MAARVSRGAADDEPASSHSLARVWPAAARTKRRCGNGGWPSGDLIHEYFSARCSILFSSDFVSGSLAVAEQDAVQAVNCATNERLQPRAQ
ncbi:hypothetical protein BSZ07_31460 [Streptomyces sp. M1013]|nr:hypothetical protein BSZ07_31460 [Streptomyces sp. M1013]